MSPSGLRIGWEKAHAELSGQVCADTLESRGWNKKINKTGKHHSSLVEKRDLFIIIIA